MPSAAAMAALVRRARSGNKGALRLLARQVLPIINARVRQWIGHRKAADDFEVDALVLAAWSRLIADARLAHLTDSLESVTIAVCDAYLSELMGDPEPPPRAPATELEGLAGWLTDRLNPRELLVFRLLYTDGCSTRTVGHLLGADETQVNAWRATIRRHATAWKETRS
jgi:hypothetical protein